jgi:hypothetical protein
MSIKASQFRQCVLSPTMDLLVPAGIPRNLVADALVFATIAQESLVGTYLIQEGGSAVGIGQIEPATLTALNARLSAAEQAALRGIMTPEPLPVQIITNLKLACAFVRLYYWYLPFPLAPTITAQWLWETYKQYYNTVAGAATEQEFAKSLGLTDLF